MGGGQWTCQTRADTPMLLLGGAHSSKPHLRHKHLHNQGTPDSCLRNDRKQARRGKWKLPSARH